jgi:hypothetical protein
MSAARRRKTRTRARVHSAPSQRQSQPKKTDQRELGEIFTPRPVHEAQELGTKKRLLQVLRHWLTHALVISVAIGLLISDATAILRQYSESQTPAPETNPTVSEAPLGTTRGRSLAELFAVAVPADLETGVIEPISTSPLRLLVIKPPEYQDEWVACLYVSLRSTASDPARLSLLAPFGSQPLDGQGTATACYPDEFSRPVSFSVSVDQASGLSIMTLPLTPSEPYVVRVVAALSWKQTVQVSEGYGRDRSYFSYDSALPSTFARLRLRAVEDYPMDFTGTLPRSYPTVREPGVEVIFAPQDTKNERIRDVAPQAGWNSEVRATWRTTPDQRRLDFVAITENVRRMRLLEARLQRSSLTTSIVIPFLVAVLIGRITIGLRKSLFSVTLRWLLALGLLWLILLMLIRELAWPPIVDTAWQWLLGLPT